MLGLEQVHAKVAPATLLFSVIAGTVTPVHKLLLFKLLVIVGIGLTVMVTGIAFNGAHTPLCATAL
jgi:hypothetical protein